MTSLLTRVNPFAANIHTTQPVDKSGEKFGATGEDRCTRRGELQKTRRSGRRISQPHIAGRDGSHIPCGRAIPRGPGLTVVLPTIHRAYYDYVLFFLQDLNNQQWGEGPASPCAPDGRGHGIMGSPALTYPVQASLHITCIGQEAARREIPG
jgi:hypothetical protein